MLQTYCGEVLLNRTHICMWPSSRSRNTVLRLK